MSDIYTNGFAQDTSTDSGVVTSSLPETNAEPSFFSKLGSELKDDFSWDQLSKDVDVVVGGVKSGYETTKNVVSTVAGDIEKPISGILDNLYWRVIIVVVVLGGVIYFAGKSGALRVSKIV